MLGDDVEDDALFSLDDLPDLDQWLQMEVAQGDGGLGAPPIVSFSDRGSLEASPSLPIKQPGFVPSPPMSMPKTIKEAAAKAAPRRKADRRSPEPPVMTTKKPKCNKSTSQRQKEEMARLREQVAVLEAHVACLAPPCSTPSSTEGSEADSAVSETDGREGMWVGLAKRQHGEKQKAEVENLKLRDALVAHAKLVNSLSRLLVKAQSWDVGQQTRWLPLQPTRNDRAIYQSMFKSVEENVYPQIDEMLPNYNLVLPPRTDSRQVTTVRSDRDDLRMEYEGSKLFPFAVDQVDDISWRALCSGKLHFGLRAAAMMTQSEDTLACQLQIQSLVKPDSPCVNTYVKTYLVLKRYRESDRIVYAWETLSMLPELAQFDSPSMQLVHRGWSASLPRKLRSGADGCSVQSFSRAFLLGNDDVDVYSHAATNSILEILGETCKQSRLAAEQSLENLLLDELVVRPKQQRVF